MHKVLSLVFAISLLAPLSAYAEEPVVISDVSAGLFRFQVKLAEQGNAEAQYKVGEMYELGKGAPKDEARSKQWYEKSAAQGHRKASYKLLIINIKKNGMNASYSQKIDTIRKDAGLGDPDAQYFLAKMYAGGIGVKKNPNTALKWYKKAAFNGIPEAEHEAIAIEEQIAGKRDARKREDKRKAAAAKKREDERKKQQQAQRRKAEAAAAKRKAQRDAEARRNAQAKRKQEELRLARERKFKAEQEQKRKEKEAQRLQQKKASESKRAFESDPCKDKKKARFLSTCR